LSFWHQTEDRIFAVPGLVSAAGFYADQGEGVNLAVCGEIVGVIAQENRNDETRAGTQAVLAESARCKGSDEQGDSLSSIADLELELYDFRCIYIPSRYVEHQPLYCRHK
jgi:hypothetical protein